MTTSYNKGDVILFRPHRGSLSDAMKLCVTIPATLESLAHHITRNVLECPVQDLSTKLYTGSPDRRLIGWPQTWIVSARLLDGTICNVGFTNGPVKESISL